MDTAIQSVVRDLFRDIRAVTERQIQREANWCKRQLTETARQSKESNGSSPSGQGSSHGRPKQPRLVDWSAGRNAMDRDVTRAIERHISRVRGRILKHQPVEDVPPEFAAGLQGSPDLQGPGGLGSCSCRQEHHLEVEKQIRPPGVRAGAAPNSDDVQCQKQLDKTKDNVSASSTTCSYLCLTHATMATTIASVTPGLSEDTVSSVMTNATGGHCHAAVAQLNTASSHTSSQHTAGAGLPVAPSAVSSNRNPQQSKGSLPACPPAPLAVSRDLAVVGGSDVPSRAELLRTPKPRTPGPAISERVRQFQARIDEIQNSNVKLATGNTRDSKKSSKRKKHDPTNHEASSAARPTPEVFSACREPDDFGLIPRMGDLVDEAASGLEHPTSTAGVRIQENNMNTSTSNVIEVDVDHLLPVPMDEVSVINIQQAESMQEDRVSDLADGSSVLQASSLLVGAEETLLDLNRSIAVPPTTTVLEGDSANMEDDVDDMEVSFEVSSSVEDEGDQHLRAAEEAASEVVVVNDADDSAEVTVSGEKQDLEVPQAQQGQTHQEHLHVEGKQEQQARVEQVQQQLPHQTIEKSTATASSIPSEDKDNLEPHLQTNQHHEHQHGSTFDRLEMLLRREQIRGLKRESDNYEISERGEMSGDEDSEMDSPV
ncbi:unnamed protein product [Amoebophrya sp. A25]|nr:unnamed protein product [Amoebophrya sp. A25]|eukprot:GSA25T00013300001.1